MPNVNKIRIDKLLSNLSVKYRPQGYIADGMAPMLSVKNESDSYRVYSRDFRLPETIRRDGAEAREAQFDISTASYLLVPHALKGIVTDRKAKNYELGSLMRDTVEDLTDALLLRKEKTVADLMTSTNWSQNLSLAAAAQVSLNTTTSNPIVRFDTAASTVLANCGKPANYAAMSRSVMLDIKNHTSVAERTKYTSAEITPKTLGALFEIPELLIANGQIDSAQEGITDSVGSIWSDNIFVGYKAPRPGINSPNAMICFQSEALNVRRWRNDERKGEMVEVAMDFDCKVVSSLSGFLIIDAQA